MHFKGKQSNYVAWYIGFCFSSPSPSSSSSLVLDMCVFSLAFAGQVQLMPSKIDHMQVRRLEQGGKAEASNWWVARQLDRQLSWCCCVPNEKWLSTPCIYYVYATLNFNGQRREVCYAKLQFTCVNLIKLPTGNVAAILMNIPHLIPLPFPVSLKYTTAVSHSSSQLLLLLPLVAQAST